MTVKFKLSMEKNNDITIMYNGKELDRMHGLDWYDYGARMYDPATGLWTSTDPLAEKYYHVSPYAYCGNNPVIFIDLDGKEWYKTNENWLIWNPMVHSQRDLQDGYTYVGKSYYDHMNNVSYRDDGTILFSNETMAYKRIWYMADTHWRSKKYPEGKEESAFLLENRKVLVMPDNWNDSNTSKMVGYKRRNGILYSPKGEAFRFVGQVHTHQGGGDKGLSQAGDVNDVSFAKRQPGKPVIIFHKNGYIYGGVYTDRLHSWHNESKLEDVGNVLNGNLSLFDIVNFMITK